VEKKKKERDWHDVGVLNGKIKERMKRAAATSVENHGSLPRDRLPQFFHGPLS